MTKPIPFSRALGALDEITTDQTTGIAIITIEDGKVSARTFGEVEPIIEATAEVESQLATQRLSEIGMEFLSH